MPLDAERRLTARQRLWLIIAGVMVVALLASLPVLMSDPAQRAARLEDQRLRGQGAAQWSAYASFLDAHLRAWPQPGDLPAQPAGPAQVGGRVWSTGGPMADTRRALEDFLAEVGGEQPGQAMRLVDERLVEPLPRGLALELKAWADPAAQVAGPHGQVFFVPYWSLSAVQPDQDQSK